MRKLATIRKIDAIEPIEGADAIEVAVVGGWKVVVKKGEFAVGSEAIYLEIDSWVPTELAPFLSKGKEPREFEGVKGERLRTVKLRGQVSQGLLLPLSVMGNDSYFKGILPPNKWVKMNENGETICVVLHEEDADCTEYLNIQKWERPLPTQLQGRARGNFPMFIRKTDQERCQNLKRNIFEKWNELEWEVSLKLDGSSLTGYFKDGETGICSRNLELKDDEDNASNSFVRTFNEWGLKEALVNIGRNVAVQGEMMGEGIQGNRENINGTQLFVFDVFDIDTQSYLNPTERTEFCVALMNNGYKGSFAPVLHRRVKLSDLGITTMDELIAFADGKSIVNPVREGLVFKCEIDGNTSWKVISNQYLLRGGD